MLRRLVTLIAVLLSLAAPSAAQDSGAPGADTFAGLELRGIGPALSSGRISDLAIHPTRNGTWYVAVASGGVWKTENAGTSWTPIFDAEGSYSIGCLALDPNDPLVVWVGTGENNNQRSVAYGDGVYKSVDGGKSWKRMGLERSEHVGRIVVDPRDSDVVYVAAQGPLWSAGGDRGLYKTRDGGLTWERSLETDEHTGANEVWIDPRNPDVLYASTQQRRRHVFTYLGSGPGSGIYKSRDAGATWQKLTAGLPKTDLGRIGLAVSPVDPDVVYAIVEAIEGAGFYRSRDAGASWEKRSDHVTSGNYYTEIVPDPHDVDRVYSMDTWMQVTEDGGATFSRVPATYKHVDDHALWIDPADADHLLSGNDGGLYESWDRGATWDFKANLPVTQFYKVAVDEAEPFYNVYGGTQDNFSIGGPSRTTSDHGIVNSDWFVTLGGDGFQSRVDPTDPNIVYSQLQYGVLVRHDRRTGESLDIQPQEEPGDDPLRWNWDSPLIISPHSHTRLYFAAQRLFRSDDRGDTWRPVSGDLTAGIDRNALEVMGRVQSVDAVEKNRSTTPYGNLVSLTESPLVEGLLAVGSDDGLVHVSGDGGETWQRRDSFPGVPGTTYVNDLEFSLHSADVLYAAFNDHKRGNFAPYLLRSDDRGASWTSIAGDLPERGSVYALAEDHVDPKLLFAGTEFGVFFTRDGGQRWTRLKGGIPTIAVRDVALQRRENDLVLATFGRGFYILDDYSVLRQASDERLASEAALFGVRRAWMYVPRRPLGLPDKSFQGDSYYTAPNPPFGAVFTYYLEDGYRTLREQRREAEQEASEAGRAIGYPSWEALEAEDREEKPVAILTVRDADDQVVRRIEGPVSKGFHRVAWDLRYPPYEPVDLSPPGPYNPFSDPPRGPLVAPGRYSVSLAVRVRGELQPLDGPREFETEVLGTASLPAPDREAVLAFQRQTGRLQRAVLGAGQAASEAQRRIDHLKVALRDAPAADSALRAELDAIETRLADLRVELEGDRTRAQRGEAVLPGVQGRVQRIVSGHWTTTSAPTATQRRGYAIAAEQFEGVLARLRTLIEQDLAGVERRAEAAAAPWTPGRLPTWQRE